MTVYRLNQVIPIKSNIFIIYDLIGMHEMYYKIITKISLFYINTSSMYEVNTWYTSCTSMKWRFFSQKNTLNSEEW